MPFSCGCSSRPYRIAHASGSRYACCRWQKGRAMSGKFPDGFLWGTATAAHQVEGGNTASDLWLMEWMKDSLFEEPSADACDHYHRYADDIALLRGLGFDTYRFSIEWARIEPEEGFFSN